MIRPPHIRCTDWETSKNLPCRYFVEGGMCAVATRFTCEEDEKGTWERFPGQVDPLESPPTDPPLLPVASLLVSPAERNRLTAASPSPPGAPFALAPPSPAPTSRGRAKELARLSLEAVAPVPPALQPNPSTNGATEHESLPPPPDPLPPLDPASVEALEQLGVEVTLADGLLRDAAVTLVPAYTQTGRLELTYRDLATLRYALDLFPGSHLVSFTRPHVAATALPKEEPDESDPLT